MALGQILKWKICMNRISLACILIGLCLSACREHRTKVESSELSKLNRVLRIAITTSTRDSGLMDELILVFEQQAGVRVDVIAAGTGKALKLGENGDVDVVLVHAREKEEAFMAAGHGTRREDVMYNMFELVGPPSDPAQIKGMKAADALVKIADGSHRFVSRGDDSGTNIRERWLWRSAGGRPDWDGYIETGQGMGATLNLADEKEAYALSDRGTYLANRDKIDLVPLAATGEEMTNIYGILTVNPRKNEYVNAAAATAFVDFMISAPAQKSIRDFRVSGESLFHPFRLPDKNDAWN